ncbi:putative AdoMet-dependent rRNA methyltransferase spb1 [Blattamonas nauphoetae]|uniref:AdoMet-dependent rRNA methyltransferase spb1 n=1 Tax=Blattamonas nauphoetae TaxID=2049346 RepID=A0ABQ9YKK5_9EUKA|nr:putative AdoMet-dependent rRNA methyltransferase spb1 [Blattamonas nauphoetae]
MDVVLHDGAPNVGVSWVHDSYVQNELVLHSMRLASEFLRKGGWFVTKVFRSDHYTALMGSLRPFFNDVKATKPVASRNVSAEIFVVCRGFNPLPQLETQKYLDPNITFGVGTGSNELSQEAIGKRLNVLSHKITGKEKMYQGGYPAGMTSLGVRKPVEEFLISNEPGVFLGVATEIVFTPGVSDVYREHPATTEDIREYLSNVRQCGKSEFRQLLKWKKKMLEVKRPTSVPSLSAKLAFETKEDKSAKKKGKSEDFEVVSEEDIEYGSGSEAEADDDDEEEKEVSDADEDIDRRAPDLFLSQLEKQRQRKQKKEKKKQEHRNALSAGNAAYAGQTYGTDEDLFHIGETFGVDEAAPQKKLAELLMSTDGKELDLLEEQRIQQEDQAEANAIEEKKRTLKLLRPTAAAETKEEYERALQMEEDMKYEHGVQTGRIKPTFDMAEVEKRKKTKDVKRLGFEVVPVLSVEEQAREYKQKKKEEREERLREGEELSEESSSSDSENIADDEDWVRRVQADEISSNEELLADNSDFDHEDDSDDEDLEQQIEKAVKLKDKEKKNIVRAKVSTFFDQPLLKDIIGDIDDESDDDEIQARKRDLSDEDEDEDKKQLRHEEESEDESGDDVQPFVVRSRFDHGEESEVVSESEDESEGDSDSESSTTDEAIDDLATKKPGVPVAKFNLDQVPVDVMSRILARGEHIKDPKKRKELIDASYNRWASNDGDLPKWFKDDEKKHRFKTDPETAESVAKYREWLRDVNEMPTKKVAEAKARKRMRMMRAIKKADTVASKAMDNIGLTEAERAREVKRAQRLAKKVTNPGKQVVVGGAGKKKKGMAHKGFDGKMHIVDRRMKKDEKRMSRNPKQRRIQMKQKKNATIRAQKKKNR